jgi:small subunit ribosomal protein S2e
LAQEKEWQPVTKLGRLVKAGKIKSMEEMYVDNRRQYGGSKY